MFCYCDAELQQKIKTSLTVHTVYCLAFLLIMFLLEPQIKEAKFLTDLCIPNLKTQNPKSCFATVTQSFSRKPVSQGRDCFLTTTSERHFFLFLPDILSNFITVWGYFLAGRGQVSKLFATTWEKCSLLRPSKSGRQLNSNATQWMKHSYLFFFKSVSKTFRNSCKLDEFW